MNDDLRCELRSRHVFPSTEAILEEPRGPDVAAAGYCGKSRVSETYSSHLIVTVVSPSFDVYYLSKRRRFMHD
jgi:hypothetical protein